MKANENTKKREEWKRVENMLMFKWANILRVYHYEKFLMNKAGASQDTFVLLTKNYYFLLLFLETIFFICSKHDKNSYCTTIL